MPRLSAVDAVGPAFSRVGEMLFHPFRLRTWVKMGFIGWLAGGVITASINYNFGTPTGRAGHFPSDPFKDLNQAIHSIHFAQFAGIMALLVIVLLVALIFSVFFTYFFSRFRFILFDAVVSGEVVIGRGWRRFRDQGNRYFGLWLLYNLLSWMVAGFIIGLPIWRAYKQGVFEGDNAMTAFFELVASLVIGLLVFSVVFGIISTLLKDFIMPLMALDNLPAGQAFSALWQYIAAEPAAWAGYLGMKLVFAIGAAIAMAVVGFIAVFILMMILAIPVGLLVWLGVAAMKITTGLGVTVFILAGLLVIVACFVLVLCVSAPVAVFFAAYAFYFFGGRYPRLGRLLWPQPPPPHAPLAVAAPGA